MDDAFSMRGRWWLPDVSSEEAFTGTLTYGDTGLRLELDGSFFQDASTMSGFAANAPRRVNRIVGEGPRTDVERASSQRVTLETCDVVERGTSSTRAGDFVREAYRPRLVCLGALFAADEPLVFDRAFVRLSSLHAWTAISGFDPDWGIVGTDEDDGVTQRYVPPEPRMSTLADGTVLYLKFPLREQHRGLFSYEKTFTQATVFELRFAEPRTFDEIRHYVLTIRNLLTLGVGEAVNVTELHAYTATSHPEEPPETGRDVQLFAPWVGDPSARDAPTHHQMVFVLRDLDEGFDRRVCDWFAASKDLGRVLDNYFSTINSEFMYLETRFMNYAQALEGYHRGRGDRPAMDPVRFDELKTAVLDSLSGKARQLAKRVLKYANEPSLEMRIRDLVSLLGPTGIGIVGAGRIDVGPFAQRAAEIRNIYAHNLDSETPDSLELAIYAEQLRTLMEALLLKELGFDTDRQIHEMLIESRRLELIRAWEQQLTLADAKEG